MIGNTLTAEMFTAADRTRFWSKVNVPAGNQDATPATCWEWTASRTVDGYGQFKLAGTTVRATRAAYAMHYGVVPGDRLICHTCDNPRCVRRTHLYLGDYADNMQDRDNAGHTRRGEDNGQAVLTLDQVNTARRRVRDDGVSVASLAREFGVNYDTLWNAVTGRRGWWSEATEPPVPPQRGRRTYTAEEQAAATRRGSELVAAGASVAAAAREVDVPYRTLYVWLKAAEVDVAAVTEGKRAARLDQARVLIAGGSSVRAAAREVGVGCSTLYAWLKAAAPAAV